jgi:hypothetical protein
MALAQKAIGPGINALSAQQQQQTQAQGQQQAQ